MTTKNLLSLF